VSLWWIHAVCHFGDAQIETITTRVPMRWHGSDAAQAEAASKALIGMRRAHPFAPAYPGVDAVAVAHVAGVELEVGAW
jgi:hypothetical protein